MASRFAVSSDGADDANNKDQHANGLEIILQPTVAGSFQERIIWLSDASSTVKIGRSVGKAKCAEDNAMFDSKVLSRNHAEFLTDGGKLFLRDTKSSNGTFLNGRRLAESGVQSEPFEVLSGDEFQFGVDVVEGNVNTTHLAIRGRVIYKHVSGQLGAGSASVKRGENIMLMHRRSMTIKNEDDYADSSPSHHKLHMPHFVGDLGSTSAGLISSHTDSILTSPISRTARAVTLSPTEIQSISSSFADMNVNMADLKLKLDRVNVLAKELKSCNDIPELMAVSEEKLNAKIKKLERQLALYRNRAEYEQKRDLDGETVGSPVHAAILENAMLREKCLSLDDDRMYLEMAMKDTVREFVEQRTNLETNLAEVELAKENLARELRAAVIKDPHFEASVQTDLDSQVIVAAESAQAQVTALTALLEQRDLELADIRTASASQAASLGEAELRIVQLEARVKRLSDENAQMESLLQQRDVQFDEQHEKLQELSMAREESEMSLKNALQHVESEHITAQARIAELEALVKDKTIEITGLKTVLAEIQAKDLESSVRALEGEGAKFQKQIASLESACEELKRVMQEERQTISGQEQSLTAKNEMIQKLERDLEVKFSEAQAEIERLEAKQLKQLTEQTLQSQAAIVDAQTKLSDAYHQVKRLRQCIATLVCVVAFIAASSLYRNEL